MPVDFLWRLALLMGLRDRTHIITFGISNTNSISKHRGNVKYEFFINIDFTLTHSTSIIATKSGDFSCLYKTKLPGL